MRKLHKGTGITINQTGNGDPPPKAPARQPVPDDTQPIEPTDVDGATSPKK